MAQHDFPAETAESGARESPRLIEVDLTPVLPGGDNGGAKTFALELLRRLIRLKPSCTFVLLTAKASHDELSFLDAPNAGRRQVRDNTRESTDGGAVRYFTVPLALLPHRVRRVIASYVLRLRNVAMRWHAAPDDSGILPDLLFCPFTATTYLKPGVPAVSTLHDLQYRAYPRFFTPEEHMHRDAVFRAACRDATRIVAISEYTRAEALATGIAEPERLRVIPHSLASRLEPSVPPAHAAEIPLAPYLLYPANFWRHKNHEMLLAGFGMAIRAGLPTDMNLVFTGAPCDRQSRLRELCEAMGLQARVVFAGHLSDPAFATLLSGAHALVFPSLFEGFGMPILEAMACGVPVASSSLTALPEICGGAALMFDPRIPGDISRALVSITTDEGLRRELIAAGTRRAREFMDADAMALAYWQVFQEAVDQGPARNRLHGMHADGWLGSRAVVDLCLPQGVEEADLVLDLEAPPWLPSPGVTLKATGSSQREESTVLVPGCSSEWRIRTSGTRLAITLSPCFVPSRLGVSSDDRELTVLLRACRIEYGEAASPCLLWPVAET